MNDIALQNAVAYAAKHDLRLAEQLGFGIHGTVHVAEHLGNRDLSAVKAFNLPSFYARELAVYLRLREAQVTAVLGFHVPQFIRADDGLGVIEMTIVTRPFALDFAGCSLDVRPQFPQEIWDDWEAQKREQFGDRWKTVRAVMEAFEEWGVFLMDVSPSNIAFADRD